MKISYAITVCNEFIQIQELIQHLLKYKRHQDEIVVLYDSKNGDTEVEAFLRSHSINGEFSWYKGDFDGHFANWKNKLNSYCTGDFIFNIDADEIPHKFLLENLPYVLENSDVDLLFVSRINTVSNLGLSHIKKWGWNISKLETQIDEKEFDLTNPQDLDEYNLLKTYNLIIEEGF